MERSEDIPIKNGDPDEVREVPINIHTDARVEQEPDADLEKPTDADWEREGWKKIEEEDIIAPGQEIYTNLQTGEKWARPLEEAKDTSFEKEETVEDAPRQEELAEERDPMSPEQQEKHHTMMDALKTQAQDIEHEGLARGLWKKIERVSEAYNKVPFKYKIAIAAGLGAASIAASGAVATGIAGAMIAQRVAGGAATAVAVEALLAKASEKEGGERSQKRVLFHRTMGLVAGGVVGSGQLVEGVSYASDKLSDGFSFLARHFSEDISNTYVENNSATAFANSTPTHADLEQGYTAPEPQTDDLIEPTPTEETVNASTETETSVETAEVTEKASMLYTVPEGGSMWDGIRNVLQERGDLDGLNEQTQNSLIDVYENRLSSLPADELHEIGISSGDPHLIYPDEKIDLTKIFDSNEYTLPHWAQELTSSQSVDPQAFEGSGYEGGEPPTTEYGPIEQNVQNDAANEHGGSNTSHAAEQTDETLEMVHESLNQDLNELYGHIGVGRSLANPVLGAESVHWIGPNGIAESSLGEIMKTNPENLDIRGTGVLSSEAMRVTQEHLKDLAERSGEVFRSNENVHSYMKRAHEALLNR